MENENGPTGHRHEGLLVNITCPSGTPRWADNENAGATKHCIDAPHHGHGARQRPPPSPGTACRDTAHLCPTAAASFAGNGLSPRAILLRHTKIKRKQKCCLSQSASTSVSMNQYVHHDQVMMYYTASSGAHTMTIVLTYETASSRATPRRQTSDSACHTVHF